MLNTTRGDLICLVLLLWISTPLIRWRLHQVDSLNARSGHCNNFVAPGLISSYAFGGAFNILLVLPSSC